MTATKVFLYDLSDPKDLMEIERLKANSQKYKIVVEETVTLPYRHIEYEILDGSQK
jgi:hypothetical protein